jgi:hypothetical protein
MRVHAASLMMARRVSNVFGLERAQIVLDTQLSPVADIQRQLLPPMPAGANGVRWAGRPEPANRVGGDSGGRPWRAYSELPVAISYFRRRTYN